MSRNVIEVQRVEQKIIFVRGHKVMLDSDLAALYSIEVRVLVQAMKRNCERFPADFMFQLTNQESKSLRSQTVISKQGRGGRRFLPYVFTENGVAMLSSVLNSPRAIQVNIQIMRVFTRMRAWLATNRDIQNKIKKLERKFDKKFVVVFEAIQLLMDRPVKSVRVKGFRG